MAPGTVNWVQNVSIATLQRSEQIQLGQVLVILASEVPAEHVQHVDVLCRTFQRLVLQSMNDPANDVKELLLDALFSGDAATFKACQIVSRLHSIVAKCSLQPLDNIQEPCSVEVQIYREVQ